MRQRDLELMKYNISKYRYRELKYFCLGYSERKKRLTDIYLRSSPPVDGMPRGNRRTDPVAAAAEEAARLSAMNDLIDGTIRAVSGGDHELERIIRQMATEGKTYNALGVEAELEGGVPPISRYQYTKLRHKFFYLLDKKKTC